jgi:hypothetical protein
MLDNDGSDFYIGQHSNIEQKEKTTEIGKNEKNILQNCAQSDRKIKFKLLNIFDRRGHPTFHFEINEKVYFYGIKGIKSDYTIILQCQKRILNSRCSNTSSILPLDSFKQFIRDKRAGLSQYPKFFDKSDPRMYDINNYDINSFDIGNGHKCPGQEIDEYLKSTNAPENGAKVVKAKLVKIANHRGHLRFHFEINDKIFFYGFRGIRADYKIVLYCTKTSFKSKCINTSSILPSEFLKQIIQNSPKYSNYPKFFNKSDPRVYDINNYDINSFKSSGSHNHPGLDYTLYL